jgi:hypothetical protein
MHETRTRKHFCRVKAVSITYSQCTSVALIIQYAQCMRRITLSSVAYLVLTHFATLSHTRHNFQENFFEHKMCFIFSNIV